MLITASICLKTNAALAITQLASEESLSFGPLSLVCPAKEVVTRVVLHPFSFQLLLFHPSVLEPDFHLSGFAKKEKEQQSVLGFSV